MRSFSWFLTLVLAVSGAAAPNDPCGTSAQAIERARQLGEWSRVRARVGLESPLFGGQAKSTTSVTLRDGIYVLDADPTNAPFFHPIDLEGKTIVLDRRDDATFMASTAPLAWDYEPGNVVSFEPAGSPIVLNLPFDFPFFNKTVRRLYVSPQHALYLAPPRESAIDQRSELEAVTSTEGIIAPFLTTPNLQPEIPTVEVKLRTDAATITWTIPDVSAVQAVVARSGYIRFGYKKLGLKGGTVVVSSGSEMWRGSRTRLASRFDDPGDVPNRIPPALAAMLDIQSVAVERISDLDLLEVRITARAPLDRTKIPDGDRVIYSLSLGNGGTASLDIDPAGPLRYYLPAWGARDDSPAGRIEASAVVFDIPQAELETYSHDGEVTITASALLSSARGGDVVAPIVVPLEAPAHRIATDFTSLNTATAIPGPIVEAFTLPAISVERVWDEVRAATGLRGEDLDGVAIYQNFLTDIILYAGAYSTGGNAGASGVTDNEGVGPTRPHAPGLMHMNAIGYGWNRSPQTASFIILHELGHHWLFFPFIMEDGERRQSINPDGMHPAQYVDFRAAFPVYTDHDVSVMGGGAFRDNRDGSFTSNEFSSYGYSWLDLYLMGLASPEEVASFFYIADSSPRLGNSYFPPGAKTVRGRRIDVFMHQIVDAMGPRIPAYPETPRNFHTVFVLLADPRRPVTDAEIASVADYRRLLERDFAKATGGRAAVTTAYEPTPIHRRSLR